MIETQKIRIFWEKGGRTTCMISMIGRILLVVLFAVASVLVSQRCAWANYPSSDEKTGVKVTQTVESDLSRGVSRDTEEDKIVTDKDIEKAYKELLNKKKEERESVKTLKADKGSFYQVKLVSGRSLLAVEIQATGDTVIITDNSGLVIRLGKREIADIKKVEE